MKKTLLIATIILSSSSIKAQLQTFMHDGLERKYILHIPSNIMPNAPLVFVMHGYSGSANLIKNYSGMNQIADNNNFAVCYPQGTTDNWNYNFWQVGYDFHVNEVVDDVGFLVALAGFLQNEHDLSTQNTFCTGMSNGGDMSYLLACQASSIFSAAAPVAGCVMEWIYNSCNPSNPIPVLEIHGTNDNTTYWNGDINNNDGWGAYMPTTTGINLFVQLLGLKESSIDTLPNLNTNDGSIVIAEKHFNSMSTDNKEVWLYTVQNGGHDWPGSYGNMDINASQEAWDFFNYSMQNSISITEKENLEKRKLLKRIDLLGRIVSESFRGIYIEIYTDGTAIKILN